MIAPKLSPGGVIGICSPSHIAHYDAYQVTLELIRQQGFRVREADNLYMTTNGYLATPEERAADFNQLIADPEVELVLFGGGEGSNELLPLIDFDAIRRNPKRICSYSDGTNILTCITAQTGLVTYYGQAPRVFHNFSHYNMSHFYGHLVHDDVREHFANSLWQPQTGGIAEGTLIGGYLRNFAMMLGNHHLPIDMNRPHILFLEDREQFGGVDYVSAMLSHIEQHDFMRSVRGLIFGNYSDAPHPELLARIRRLGEKFCIPTVYCDDFGHGSNMAILPIGREALLDADNCRLIYR